jgi:homoserine kinase
VTARPAHDGAADDAVSAVRVRVPATSANLGPGFDVLGIALSLHNDVTILGPEPSGRWRVRIEGEGHGSLPGDESSQVVQAMLAAAKAVGSPVEPCSVLCKNRIPVARGMGSSAAAIVGGLVAANVLLGGLLSADELLAEAARLEGHGDNVAAALAGGLTVFYRSADGPRALRCEPTRELAAVLVIPPAVVFTPSARRVLPDTLSYDDAEFQMARAAMLVHAVSSGRLELLEEATRDRMHQPHRLPGQEGFARAAEALRSAGALGVSLSGSGPAVLGWARRAELGAVKERAELALASAGDFAVLALELDLEGATVLGASAPAI